MICHPCPFSDRFSLLVQAVHAQGEYKVPYPFTSATAHNTPEAVARVNAGEQNLHYCPQPRPATAPPPPTTTTSTAPPFFATPPPAPLADSTTSNTTCNLHGLDDVLGAYLDCWHLKAVIVISSVIFAALLCLCCIGLCKTNSKTTRAVKPMRKASQEPEAASEAGESAPLIPQPAPVLCRTSCLRVSSWRSL